MGACAHAFAASSQLSTVHATPSSQLGGAPGVQAPATHVSGPLQKRVSSHSAFVAQGPIPLLLDEPLPLVDEDEAPPIPPLEDDEAPPVPPLDDVPPPIPPPPFPELVEDDDDAPPVPPLEDDEVELVIPELDVVSPLDEPELLDDDVGPDPQPMKTAAKRPNNASVPDDFKAPSLSNGGQACAGKEQSGAQL